MDYDKKLHFAAGFLISTLFVLFSHNIVLSLGAAILAGIGKEAYDWLVNRKAKREGKLPPHSVEFEDAAMISMGGAMGVCVVSILFRLV
jgi:hypothetical protein